MPKKEVVVELNDDIEIHGGKLEIDKFLRFIGGKLSNEQKKTLIEVLNKATEFSLILNENNENNENKPTSAEQPPDEKVKLRVLKGSTLEKIFQAASAELRKANIEVEPLTKEKYLEIQLKKVGFDVFESRLLSLDAANAENIVLDLWTKINNDYGKEIDENLDKILNTLELAQNIAINLNANNYNFLPQKVNEALSVLKTSMPDDKYKLLYDHLNKILINKVTKELSKRSNAGAVNAVKGFANAMGLNEQQSLLIFAVQKASRNLDHPKLDLIYSSDLPDLVNLSNYTADMFIVNEVDRLILLINILDDFKNDKDLSDDIKKEFEKLRGQISNQILKHENSVLQYLKKNVAQQGDIYVTKYISLSTLLNLVKNRDVDYGIDEDAIAKNEKLVDMKEGKMKKFIREQIEKIYVDYMASMKKRIKELQEKQKQVRRLSDEYTKINTQISQILEERAKLERFMSDVKNKVDEFVRAIYVLNKDVELFRSYTKREEGRLRRARLLNAAIGGVGVGASVSFGFAYPFALLAIPPSILFSLKRYNKIADAKFKDDLQSEIAKRESELFEKIIKAEENQSNILAKLIDTFNKYASLKHEQSNTNSLSDDEIINSYKEIVDDLQEIFGSKESDQFVNSIKRLNEKIANSPIDIRKERIEQKSPTLPESVGKFISNLFPVSYSAAKKGDEGGLFSFLSRLIGNLFKF